MSISPKIFLRKRRFFKIILKTSFLSIIPKISTYRENNDVIISTYQRRKERFLRAFRKKQFFHISVNITFRGKVYFREHFGKIIFHP